MNPRTTFSPARPCQLTVTRQDWPLKAPFHITGHRFDTSATIVVTLRDGPHEGRGEGAGVYYRGETPATMTAAIEAVRPAIEAGADRDELAGLLPPGGARNALDCALWDLACARDGESACALAGLPPARPLLTTWTVGAASPAEMAGVARGYGGARALKLKLLGDGLDAERVRAVRRERPEVWLGVDANQGFVPETLRAAWPVFEECGVALVEQPFAVGQDEWLAEMPLGIPFGADESVQSRAEMAMAVRFYDVVNIKLDKCGGLTEGLAMAALAREMGLKVMVGNMTGSSLGMAPALVLGQCCDIVDLDGPIFLARDHFPGVHYAGGCIGIAQEFWGRLSTAPV